MFSKELLKGTLSAIILKLLAENGKMYGYEIVQHVHELSDKKILIKDGSLYPCLQKLTEDGILSFKEEIVSGRVRKYYFLTATGKKMTAAYMNELEDFISTINQIMFSKNKTKFA
ncbi:MAG: PadR family transcriptional regulator [Cyclobacteriaceae bacterium]